MPVALHIVLGLVLIIIQKKAVAQMGFTVYPSRYQIEARYIVQLPRFVDWPVDAFHHNHSPIILGVLGEDPFGINLDKAVQDQRIRERSLSVRRLRDGDDPKTCHLLYLGLTDARERARILKELEKEPILTLGDSDDFLAAGGMITFFIEGRHVRFSIDHENVNRSGLRMSSRLLKLSQSMHQPSNR
jgi:hypothetical protein